MSAFNLPIDGDWSARIGEIRDATTEDTNLIRFDNSFYRVCRDNPGTFQISLYSDSIGGTGVVPLTMQLRDLYITQIGHRPFETYAATVGEEAPQAQTLRGAVHALQRGQLLGDDLFLKQSVLVLCVAESLRSDYTATVIEQTIRASTTGLLGVPTRLRTGDLLRAARSWGQASDAIFRSLSPQARQIAMRSRASLSPEQRRFFEPTDIRKIDPELRDVSKAVKVLKRPAAF